MPRSKAKVYRLSAAFIENAHDFGIEMVWPGIEPVNKITCLNFNLLHSAAAQPYQECFGQELYPTLAAKAAYLFIHIATGHIFSNGNKRTAAICLDTFLLANSHYLTLSNKEVHDVAQRVASSGERGERFEDMLLDITSMIKGKMIPLSAFRKTYPKEYRSLHSVKRLIRNAEFNQPDYRLIQRG